MYIVEFIFLLILAAASDSYKWYPYSKHRYCNRPGAQCVSRNSFIYCPDSWFYLKTEQEPLWCPEGYICSDKTNYPCIKDPREALNTPKPIFSCFLNTNLEVYDTINTFFCDKYRGIKCVSKNTFIYCSHKWQFFLTQYDALNCPLNYICQENLVTPCIQDPQWMSKECSEATKIQNNRSRTSSTVFSHFTQASAYTTIATKYSPTINSGTTIQTQYRTPDSDSTQDNEEISNTINVLTTPKTIPINVEALFETTDVSKLSAELLEHISDLEYIESTSNPPGIREDKFISTSNDEMFNQDYTGTTETTENLQISTETTVDVLATITEFAEAKTKEDLSLSEVTTKNNTETISTANYEFNTEDSANQAVIESFINDLSSLNNGPNSQKDGTGTRLKFNKNEITVNSADGVTESNNTLSTENVINFESITSDLVVNSATTNNHTDSDSVSITNKNSNTQIFETSMKTDLSVEKTTTSNFPKTAFSVNTKFNSQNISASTTKIFTTSLSVSQTLSNSTSAKTQNNWKTEILTNKDSIGLFATTPGNIASSSLPPKYSTPPSCSREGVIYAAANCRQYYQCQKFLFFWVTAYLKTCNAGMGFKSIEMKCVPLSNSDCKHT